MAYSPVDSRIGRLKGIIARMSSKGKIVRALFAAASSVAARQSAPSAVSGTALLLRAAAPSSFSSSGPAAAIGFSIYRSFASSGGGLVKVLDAEIKEENENYAKPAEIAQGPPAPWSLLEGPDDTLLTLVRFFIQSGKELEDPY